MISFNVLQKQLDVIICDLEEYISFGCTSQHLSGLQEKVKAVQANVTFNMNELKKLEEGSTSECILKEE